MSTQKGNLGCNSGEPINYEQFLRNWSIASCINAKALACLFKAPISQRHNGLRCLQIVHTRGGATSSTQDLSFNEFLIRLQSSARLRNFSN